MGASWHIFVGLVALVAFSGIYITLDDVAVGNVNPVVEDVSDSEEAQTNANRTREMWNLLPVFATIAVVLYWLRESVFQRGVR